MLRQAAALLLLSAVALPVLADDPSLPIVPGPTLGPTPIAEPTPLQGYPSGPSDQSGSSTYSHSIPGGTTHEYQSTPEYQSVSPQPSYSTDSAPVYSSGPVIRQPLPSYESYDSYAAPLSAPVGSAGCACNGGASVYSGSSLGLPAGDAGYVGDSGVGYQAMGYHGGGMETYTGAVGNGMHVRHPYYSYRRPWYANGPMSHNVSIAW